MALEELFASYAYVAQVITG